MNFEIFSKEFNIPDEIFKAYLAKAVPRFVKNLKEAFNSPKNSTQKKTDNAVDPKLENKIINHIISIYNWSNDIEFIRYGGHPIKTASKSIKLNLTFDVKRLLTVDIKKSKIDEDYILNSRDQYLILGDPGAGKTTTAKRMMQKYFASPDLQERFSYPLLIRFRDLKEEWGSIYTYMAFILGIQYDTFKIPYTVKEKQSRFVNVNNELEEVISYKTVEKIRIEHKVNDSPLEKLIKELLEENKFLLIFDGFDEIDSRIIDIISREVSALRFHLNNAKIIMTSRPGYVEYGFEGFSICQVCELNENQISKIVKLWVKSPKLFLNDLEGKPYKDLANRPLFLSFLILLYLNEDQKLPERALEVYKRIIQMFLELWDKNRSIERISKYSNFNNTRKEEFLVYLAYVLTYKIKSRSFSKNELIVAYLKICKRFSLPETESELVAIEIENHTGIIVSAYNNKFEFSHLSLQEYLCAQYILNTPSTDLIVDYFFEFPSPLAVAIAHSYNSSAMFTNIFMTYLPIIRIKTDRSWETQRIVVILERLLIEQPYFEEDLDLGITVMYLCNRCDCSNKPFFEILDKFVDYHENILNSIRLVTSECIPTDSRQEEHRIIYKPIRGFKLKSAKRDINFPLYLPRDLVKKNKLLQL